MTERPNYEKLPEIVAKISGSKPGRIGFPEKGLKNKNAAKKKIENEIALNKSLLPFLCLLVLGEVMNCLWA